MKKIRKIFKVIFIFSAIFFSLTIIGSVSYYLAVTNSVNLDLTKIEETKQVSSIKVYDTNHKEIKPTSSAYIPISKLSINTKDAFISAEDKRFYKHNGLDYIRIGGAIISNIKSKSFSEGASTISQQLIKNTQLSNEKTIKRKLKEIKLTKQLENKYSKSEILEMYLNNIYFGNGCYGIENASKHYFNKSASELSLSESTILAGTINAPTIYDIEDNYEKANERKNLIIDLMLSQKKITVEEASKAKNEKPKLNLNKLSTNNFLYSQIINEAKTILNTSETILNNSKYKIYTSINTSLNKEIENISNKYDIQTNPDVITIVINNKTHGIVAITGKNKILSKKWQPGSTIKPILVYAPAIESGQITPSTKILDNKINISGYSPENADKKYHGFVSVKECLSNSYNIPAVKILNEYGISNAQTFAKNLGIEFTDSDNNLAIALGGFSEGITPKSLCDAYSAFALKGKFQPSTYITKITKDGKEIYKLKNNEKQVMKETTAYQITDMLLETSKTGTGKRLKALNYNIASKTGTVGKTSSTKNTCCYNVAYTTEHTILTFICGDNMPENINGSTYPTMITKDIADALYKNKKPKDFEKPKNLFIANLVEESNQTISESKQQENNKSNNQENLFKLSVINTPNTKPILCFTLNKNYDFSIIKTQKKEEKILFSSSKNDQNFIKFEDKSVKNNEIIEYKIKFCEKTTNEEFYSNSIKIKTF